MKFLKTIGLIVAILGIVVVQVDAQKAAKEELKLWKKKAKEYKKNPLSLKNLVEDAESLEPEIDKLQQQVRDLRKENANLEAQLNKSLARQTSLEGEIARLNSQLVEANRAAEEMVNRSVEPAVSSNSQIETSEEYVQGVVFRVQIGAYKKRRMKDDLVTSTNLNLEEAEGLQKVVVGQFREIEKAKELQQQLEIMGVKGAWIVPYRDGIRIPLREALKG